ncbi:MAG: methylated-DNA--[protein]-cysteine S-methyltransferase [Hyphomicrobiales bacterium]
MSPRARKPLEEIAVTSLRSPMGKIWILATERGVREIRLGKAEAPSRREARARDEKYVRRPRWTDPAKRAVEAYLAGDRTPFDLPLDLGRGTPFMRRVWEATRRVRHGAVASYATIAASAGAPKAVRAVGNALGANPIPIVIPCHRVVHSDRSLGGFSSGLAWKRFLLELERGQFELTLRPRKRLGLFG